MAYPMPQKLVVPLSPYEVGGYRFRQIIRRRVILWAWHLGDDITADPGTPVAALGDGEVVWSETRPGTPEKRNWGGNVVVAHTHWYTGKEFFSVYGHLTDLKVKFGDTVCAGDEIGRIAPGNTPENGWWKTPHLHFAIYTGPWQNEILPGYKRPEELRTRLGLWQDPQKFIADYNRTVEAGKPS